MYHTIRPLVVSFPGGIEKLSLFFFENFKYPEGEFTQGSLYIEFVIDEEGTIQERGIRGRTPEEYTAMDKEGLRIVGLMPKWKPAMCDGKPVPFLYPYYIRCMLPQE